MCRIWPRSFCVSSAATARKRNEAPTDDIQPGKTRSITETVFFLNSSWFWTDLSFVSQACKLLSDDYEQVRSAAVQMVWVLSQLYPERWTNRLIYYGVINTWFMEVYMLYIFVCPIFCMKECNIFFSSPPFTLSCSIVPIPSSNEEIRLIDDSFGKICHMVSDGSWVVRVQAAKLLVHFLFYFFFFDWRFLARISLHALNILFCNLFVFVFFRAPWSRWAHTFWSRHWIRSWCQISGYGHIYSVTMASFLPVLLNVWFINWIPTDLKRFKNVYLD